MKSNSDWTIPFEILIVCFPHFFNAFLILLLLVVNSIIFSAKIIKIGIKIESTKGNVNNFPLKIKLATSSVVKE